MAELQTGIALHQWERGKAARNILSAPDGFLLAEFDASGQEMRLMADASQDATMLSLFEQGIDAHAFMGASIERLDWHWVHDEQDRDPKAKAARYLGKFCIAEGELVLTDRGLVPIEKVLLADRVWDGLEWVTHTGSVYQGEKRVITYQGLTATEDHRVYLEDGTNCWFSEAAEKNNRLAKTGDGRAAIRLVGDCWYGSNHQEQRDVSGMHLHEMSTPVPRGKDELAEWEKYPVQELRHETATRKTRARNHCKSCRILGTKKMQCDGSTMSKQKRQVIQKLWGARGTVQLRISGGSNSVCARAFTTLNISKTGRRQNRQQRSLRSREFTLGISERQFKQHSTQHLLRMARALYSKSACVSRIANTISRCALRRTDRSKFCVQGIRHGRNTRQILQSAELQTKRVWDITNAGPRHRYTVSNYLISNSNLSLQYRIGVDTMMVRALTQYDLQLTQPRAAHIKQTYLQTYPGIPTYWNTAIQFARAKGYAETKGHRRLATPNMSDWTQQQTAINLPIQGTGADMKALAIAVCSNMFDDTCIYGWDLHDALFIYVKDDATAKGKVLLIQEVLNNLPYQKAWGWTPSVELPWDAKYGKTWGTLKGVEA